MTTKIPLILGSTGKTGSRVVSRFQAAGLPFRAGSRSSALPFDWYDEGTWGQALTGVGSVYVVFYPDLAVPGTQALLKRFIEVAKGHEVEHLVLLSGRGEPEAQACEALVQTSGLKWTVVRASWFAQNFSESFLRDAVLQGQVYLPVGDVAEPFIDIEDLADVVFAVLQDPDQHQQVYEVTGPELWTMQQAVQTLGRITGRDIQYQQIPLQAYVQGMEAAGLPQEMIALLSYLFREVMDGRNAFTGQGVQAALGRAPRRFEAYARAAHQQGAWSVPVLAP